MGSLSRQRVTGKNVRLDDPHRKSSNLTYEDLVDKDEKVSKGVGYAQSIGFFTLGLLVFYFSNTYSAVTSPSSDLNWCVFIFLFL